MKKYPSIPVLTFVVGGVILADLSRWPAELFVMVGLILTVVSLLVLRLRERPAVIGLMAALGALAAFNFALTTYDFGPGHYQLPVGEDQEYECFGRVDGWPLVKADRTELRIEIDSVVADEAVGRAVSGAILLKVSDTTTVLQRGDRIRFRARLYDLPSGSWPGPFDYQRYLNLKGVVGLAYLPNLAHTQVIRPGWEVHRPVNRLRSLISESFNRHLSPEAAGLAKGFLIGETRDIPAGVYRLFRRSGTLHLLAVSGSNVALVVLFALVVLRPLGLARWLRSVLLLVVVLLFAGTCQGQPSVVRASLMAALVILGGMLQRRVDLNNIIALAAMLILLYEPAQLFDVGFQLSFVTAWGLIFILPRFARQWGWAHRAWWYRWLLFPLLVTVVAQVCAAPISAYYFQQVSAVSPVANLVVVPMVSVAVVLELTLVTVDLIWSGLADILGIVLEHVLGATQFVVERFGAEGVPVLETNLMPGWLVLAVYPLLVLLTLGLRRRWARRGAVVYAAVLLNLLLGQRLVSGWERTPSTDLHILAVPGGEAVIFQGADPRAADLILTNLIRRTYPIDERILAPALTRVGVSKLGRVVVLEADHGALDDLLRVTRTYHADSFLVAPELQNAVADVLLHQGIPYPIDLVAADSCLSVRSEEIRFHLGDVDLTYVRSSRPALGAAVGEQSDVLLLGRQAAARTGPAEIVARVAVGSNWLDSDRDLSAPVSGADYSASRFDLAYFGALRIRVLDGRRDSLQTRLYP